MNNFDFKTNQKDSFRANTLLTVFLLIMMIIFHHIGAKIPALLSFVFFFIYLFNYYPIYKLRLRWFIWNTYAMLTIFMSVCTVCLGFNYGFSLYSLSTVPLIHYIRYISFKLESKDPKAGFWTILIIVFCMSSSLFSVYHGPIYKTEGWPPVLFNFMNLLCVCFFIGTYSQGMISIIVESEKKLSFQANHDSLTGLSNRHFMHSILAGKLEKFNPSEPLWIAMIDIDKFKGINDTYGHSSGDEVLKKLSGIMLRTCTDCDISRWGGEEFLVCGKSKEATTETIEKLRACIEQEEMESNGHKIKFTITAGVSFYEEGQTIDLWLMNADNKLYEGKRSGRNRVIY